MLLVVGLLGRLLVVVVGGGCWLLLVVGAVVGAVGCLGSCWLLAGRAEKRREEQTKEENEKRALGELHF